jgi:catechol 2,3-dioxygenase
VAVAISKVGHVVLRVADADRSSRFYCDALGLAEVARGDFGEGTMVFLSTGNAHHDLALVETSSEALQVGNGLHHFAFKVGDSIEALSAAKAQLGAARVPIQGTLDFRVSQALFIQDPDGHLIELYVDAHPEEWRSDPTVVANASPLDL